MKKEILNKQDSYGSISQSFLAKVEMNRKQKTENFNPKFFNEIKEQANVILKNIENQIEQCQLIKRNSNSKFSYTHTKSSSVNRQKYQQQKSSISIRNSSRPFTTMQNTQIQKQQFQKQYEFESNIELIQQKKIQNVTNKTLDLNTLCDKDKLMGNFKLETILGNGSFAMVRLCINKQTKEKYAIKIYDKLKLNDTQKMNNVKREISILKRIEHPYIIKLFWAIEDKKSINLVMEYCSSISLASYMKSKPNKIIEQQEAISIFYQIAIAIKYLHDKNIAHRDIKLDNILFMNNMCVKLIDFGFAICMPQSQKTNIFCGTPNYMSPEIISKIPHHPFCADIWSLGILFTKILTGEYPYKATNDRELQKQIQQAKWQNQLDKKIDQNILRVIKGCLEKEINLRWDINKIINDPLFHNNKNEKDINIYKL